MSEIKIEERRFLQLVERENELYKIAEWAVITKMIKVINDSPDKEGRLACLQVEVELCNDKFPIKVDAESNTSGSLVYYIGYELYRIYYAAIKSNFTKRKIPNSAGI